MRRLSIRSLGLGRGVPASAVLAALAIVGCNKDDRGGDVGLDDGIGEGIDGDGDSEGIESEEDNGDDGNDEPLLDMSAETDGEVPCGEGDLCEGECEIPPHTPCDAPANAPLIQTM